MWQGVEFALLQAARDEEVARTLGAGIRKDWCLDFDKIALIHILAHAAVHIGAAAQHCLQLGAAQVEVAVGKAQVFIGLVGLAKGLDGQCLGFVEHL